ncbi:hypothetical protein F5Y17DRAFT_334162 [Xylariaceae sp. FL0594]|nr:hypothetical protein F5Y17DRAFT_334162 [Xylariaceae sp. FL0594]
MVLMTTGKEMRDMKVCFVYHLVQLGTCHMSRTNLTFRSPLLYIVALLRKLSLSSARLGRILNLSFLISFLFSLHLTLHLLQKRALQEARRKKLTECDGFKRCIQVFRAEELQMFCVFLPKTLIRIPMLIIIMKILPSIYPRHFLFFLSFSIKSHIT